MEEKRSLYESLMCSYRNCKNDFIRWCEDYEKTVKDMPYKDSVSIIKEDILNIEYCYGKCDILLSILSREYEETDLAIEDRKNLETINKQIRDYLVKLKS